MPMSYSYSKVRLRFSILATIPFEYPIKMQLKKQLIVMTGVDTFLIAPVFLYRPVGRLTSIMSPCLVPQYIDKS